MRMKGLIFAVALLSAAFTTAVLAPAASAHTGTITISCASVTFAYSQFPKHGTNVINESVEIDGVTVAARSFTFTGSTATDTIPAAVGAGRHVVRAHALWTQNGGGKANLREKFTDCQPTTN